MGERDPVVSSGSTERLALEEASRPAGPEAGGGGAQG